MKKLFTLFTTLVLTLLCTCSGLAAFAVEISEDGCDRCFRETLTGLMDGEGYQSTVINAHKQPLYDIYANPLGYVYDFNASGEDGFAVIIYDDSVGDYTASEVFLHGGNPYRGCTAMCVYVTSMTYWELADGVFTDLSCGEQVPEEVVKAYEEIAFTNTFEGGVTYTTENVFISYVSKDYTYHPMAAMCPRFTGGYSIPNGCAAVAGGNLLGYFDRYYEDLLPNHSAGYMYYTVYIYNGEDSYVEGAIDELYSYMDITSEHGATVDSFKAGMKTYCSGKGRSVSFTSCKNGGALDYNLAVQKMQSGQPLAIFLNTYTVSEYFPRDNNEDYYYYYKFKSNHVMAGFGSREIVYTMSDGSTQTTQLICVATGLSVCTEGYFNVNFETNIIECYAVNIT